MKRLPRNRVPVCVSVPFDELADIDETAYSLNLSRSDFMLQATRKEMQRVKNGRESQNQGI